MDRGMFQVARAATAPGEIVSLELPDINVTDCALVQVKRVSFTDETQHRPFKLRDRKSGSPSRADERRRIMLEHRPVWTPQATAALHPRSPDADAPPPHLKMRKDTSGLLPPPLRDELMRRFSSPNPVPLSDFKPPVKKSVSLPPSPIMVRRRGSRTNSVSGDVRATPRPNSSSTNCFGRNRSLADNSARPASSHAKSGFQSAYNDPEINPILIFPDQAPLTPSNMHMRSTGFELRHRVMRRAFRLSDLSATGSSGEQRAADTPPSADGGEISSEQREESTEGSKSRTGSGTSLEEQFKVLQNCRYLRHPVDNLL